MSKQLKLFPEAEAKVVKEFENQSVEYHVKSVKESKIIKILE